jgi:hypothetical protein
MTMPVRSNGNCGVFAGVLPSRVVAANQQQAGHEKCGQVVGHGVTVTLLNCEVLSVVVLPLATARPM